MIDRQEIAFTEEQLAQLTARPVDNFEAGVALLAAITKRRQQRGYQPIE